MRFIHCSDIHLDSAMKNLKEGKAKERKDELRLSFENMIKVNYMETIEELDVIKFD